VQYHVTLGYLGVLYVSIFHVLDRYIRIVISLLGRSMYAILIVFLPVSRSCQINSEFDINRPIFYMTFHYNKWVSFLSSSYVLLKKCTKPSSYRYINTFIILCVVISVLDKYKYHIIMAMILLIYKCLMSFLHDTTLLIHISPL
jgi:hypothetical protein